MKGRRMSKPIVTASDLARASKLKAFITEPLATDRELASVLAEIREEAIMCAMIRVERGFVAKKRTAQPNCNGTEDK